MIRLIHKISGVAKPDVSLTLPLHERIKSRLRVMLDDGRDAGLFLERGTTLKHGELLAGDDGITVLVLAADETLSIVRSEDPLLLARACYHLGNRHMSVQILPGEVRYLHDHVLDDMLRGLGLDVSVERTPFEPEPGAYGGSADSHVHHHDHDHHH
jgi:urease accessory protein